MSKRWKPVDETPAPRRENDLFSDSSMPMTAANKNVILIVALGAIACLLSIFLSQFFAKKIYDNETLLARIGRLPPAVEHLQILSKSFVQSGDPVT
ncbi:MAG: hypothetical protein H6974_07200 [Gammaproteobacteria bacterium]|nr:hypothetical protein [Gammaproteobacteria bacterium]